MTYAALAADRPLRPLPLQGADRQKLQAELVRNTPDAFWHGAVRQLLAREPEVLQ
jgi:hypothetical protein